MPIQKGEKKTSWAELEMAIQKKKTHTHAHIDVKVILLHSHGPFACVDVEDAATMELKKFFERPGDTNTWYFTSIVS